VSKTETPQPWAENWQAQRLLALLETGPKSTVELQTGTRLVHVARQVWELRHWYGWVIRTKRLPNRVAVYELAGRNPHIEVAPTVHKATPVAPIPSTPVVQTELWDA
jgi:hypothetical protein